MSDLEKKPAPAGARKRFWKQATVVPVQDEGFAVQLDGRPVRLPEKTMLSVSSRALADALAAEWQAAGLTVGGHFRPEDLPLTRIAGSMLERIPGARAGVIDSLLAYAGSDLLCYREAGNSRLARRQCELWSPWLDWCQDTFGMELRTTEGVMPITQPDATMKTLRALLESLSDAELAVLGVVVPALGSLYLGLVLVKGQGTPEELVACATLDEREQMAIWGEDTDVTDRIAMRQRDVTDATHFLELLRGG
ncbi:ATP synthase F1 [Acetobacter cerevisiae]|uniref:ATP synthase F1 n=1 Tax=Acetobacter cerevisiae TaxID=178900 RepID=A0A149UVK0_9PROT|nr:ATP12 family protein [Acetobacter cerevisiae]KXV71962.1 ATP synthase F1 [Acetobacter cerevisiae]